MRLEKASFDDESRALQTELHARIGASEDLQKSLRELFAMEIENKRRIAGHEQEAREASRKLDDQAREIERLEVQSARVAIRFCSCRSSWCLF